MQFDAVREVLENFDEVRLAYLFGSVAAGTARPASDLDVAVVLAPDAMRAAMDRLIEVLEGASSRAVDLVDLSVAPPLLAHEVIRQGNLILNRDETERVEFTTRAVARYLDTAHLRKAQHHYLRERVGARNAAVREFVRKKLLQIEQATARLRSWMPVSLETLELDLKLQWAIERGLQIAAEALFDAGNHVLTAEFRESVDQYREIPTRLAARGVLTEATSARLTSLSGFRDILVHHYAEIDLTKILAGLDRLDDFDAFVADVERWLQQTSSG